MSDLYLVDVSVSALVYEQLGLNFCSPFAGSRIVRVDSPAGLTVSDACEGAGTT